MTLSSTGLPEETADAEAATSEVPKNDSEEGSRAAEMSTPQLKPSAGKGHTDIYPEMNI